MKKIYFTQQFDWPFIDPYCACKKVVSYKKDWSGTIRNDIADAAIEANRAYEIVEKNGDDSDD